MTVNVPGAIVDLTATLNWMHTTKKVGGLGYSVLEVQTTRAYNALVKLGSDWPVAPGPVPTPSPTPAGSVLPAQGVTLDVSFLGLTAAKQAFVLDKCVELFNGKTGWARVDWFPNDPAADAAVAAVKAKGIVVMGLYNRAYADPYRGTSAQYAAACAQLAAKPDVDFVNTGNEFDMNGWAPADYAAYAIAAYQAVGGRKPVLAPSIAKTKTQTGAAMLAYFTSVLAAAKGQPFANYFPFSLYGDRLDPNTSGDWNPWPYVPKMRAIADNAGYQDVPLAAVEGGDNADTKGTANQANAVANGMDARSATGIATFGGYTMLDNTDAPGFGLLDNQLNERPAYAAMKARAR